MKTLNSKKNNIAVIGAGSWGTALALVLSKNVSNIKLWDFDPKHVAVLKKDKENKRYMPGIIFPDNIRVTSDLRDAVCSSSIVVMVVPTHGYRKVFNDILGLVDRKITVISASKGVENDTLLTMSQIMDELLIKADLPYHVETAVLSGPSFAREVADEVPTAVTLGCKVENVARHLQKIFNTSYFRVYTSKDLVGLEISAALKNIVAIAAGISDGLKFGTNTRAALITRGLAEISRLGIILGAEATTFYGLSGMGDLVLTCTGDLSRNRTVGLKLGEGKTIEQVLEEMSMVAEGVKTTKSVHDLALKKGVDMPILNQVYKIIYEKKDCRTAVIDLLNRDLKPE